eukprot:m.35441 g.35441  ORF g.35441 m.35441 type:complete len:716 (-) comp17140_c0_seq1:147-2294(-)
MFRFVAARAQGGRNNASIRVLFQPRCLSTSNIAQSELKIKKLLVANRGEIACRVMKTCRKLGIKTVAVYSEADADAMHVRDADEKFLLGPAPSSESYLRMDKLLEAVEFTGADAVHPGYGFLSENSEFAEALESRGVAFVGPKTFAIEVMGDKLESKVAADNANVNTIPGFNGLLTDVEHALKLANDIGYPVMLKASAGGGGKGMRPAWDEAGVREGYTLSKAEAIASFGDDRLLIERFIDTPRHIEIQVLGDSFGNYVYLNERECSIQRRNQKVIEEAPSMFIDPETRKKMGEQAVALARAVQYQSAGTVEFLVDSQKNFYFLEMNTRLQVEHPISECITGVDLVEQMIRVAGGEKLSVTQDDIGIKGWAIESRVYAEDSENFMPSIGRLNTYMEPTASNPDAEWPDVRVDTGVEEGSEISMFYDPMICKLITYGRDRPHAIELMKHALDSYVIKGVQHNIPLLRDIIRQERFISGDISTNFLPEVYPDKFTGYILNDAESHNLIAAAAFMHVVRNIRGRQFVNYATDSSSTLPESLGVVIGDKRYNVDIDSSNKASLAVTVNGITKLITSIWSPGDILMECQVDGETVLLQHLGRDEDKMTIRVYGSEFEVAVRDRDEHEMDQYFPEIIEEIDDNVVVTPMPGVCISIDVQPGDIVAAGQTVAVLEAMKMQNALVSPRAGVVKAILVKIGDKLMDDDVLVELEVEEEEVQQTE